MNKNIDLANLLKDCPKGMPLDCAMFDDVTFTGVEKKNKPISIRAGEIYYYLTEFGTWSYDENAKCVIFPKGKTTWEGFQRPFKDGDILYIDCNDDENTNEQYQYTFILKEISDGKIYCYCYIDEANIHKEFEICLLADMRYNPRLATEEEKQKLFDVLKKEGYEWDAEKKELKPLQQFKDGDIVATNDGKYIAIIKNNGGKYYVCCHPNVNYFHIDRSGWFDRLATEEEKATLFQAIKDNGYKWNAETKTLEKLVEQKFNDGDVVTTKSGLCTGIVRRHVKLVDDAYQTYIAINGESLVHDDNIFYFERLATEEEKQKLFKVLEKNGYKWNSETKTLEKLIVPKFKVGDKIKLKGGDETGIITQVSDRFYIIKCKNNTHYWSIKIQDEWELLVITPKFKVGDIIRSKNGLQIYKITNVTSEYYSVQIQEHDCIGVLPVKDQDDWILIPNRLITEYKIYYTRDSTGEDHHLTFSTQEAMEGCLECMRETNKTCTTYLNIVCQKETVETLDL